MAILTVITEAYPSCEECGEATEIIIHHLQAGTTEARCYSCLTAIVLAAHAAFTAATEEHEGETDDGTGTANGRAKRVRGHRGGRVARRTVDGGADGGVVVETEAEPNGEPADEGGERTADIGSSATGDRVGVVGRDGAYQPD